MFDIAFTSTEPELQDEGWPGLWGRTVLGEHAEAFLAPITPWSRADYERQWLEAAERLLGPERRAAFFTAAFRFWWAMWRDGERVYVHEELLTPERLAGVADFTRAPYHLIRDRVTHSEDGAPVSEWQISAADVRDFVVRRSDQSVPT